MRTGRIDRYSSFTTEIVSWRSTMLGLIWAFRWIAAASMAHPDLRLCPQKRLLNGYQMPRVKRLATGVTAAERKRRQRNLFPHLKIFLQKRPPQKGYPLSGENRFWTGFWERGHEQFSESRSPPTGPLPGGRIRAHILARLRCAEPCQLRPGAGDGRQSR